MNAIINASIALAVVGFVVLAIDVTWSFLLLRRHERSDWRRRMLTVARAARRRGEVLGRVKEHQRLQARAMQVERILARRELAN